MRRETVSGVALILGSVGILVTMALHPAPHSLDSMIRQAGLAVGTHSLALASIPVSFIGFLGLSRHLESDNIFVPAALVTYAFGAVAVMCAAIFSGLVAPGYAIGASGDPDGQATLLAILRYGGHINQSFATVFMFAMCAAIIFWSIAILRTRRLPPWTGWLGSLVGFGALIGVLVGVLDTSVGGFGLFVLSTSAWVVAVGVALCRTEGTSSLP